jgi:hypothetical protein
MLPNRIRRRPDLENQVSDYSVRTKPPGGERYA